MNERRQRPGVILYFDTLCPALARLTNEQAGAMLRGIVDYAQTGAIPELDNMAGMAFDMLRPGIDRDGERYFEQIEQRRYAVYCREAKKRGADPISFESWQRMISDDIGRYPTTTPASSSNPSPYPYPSSEAETNTSPAAAAEGKGGAEGCKGEGRENPSALHAQFLDAIRAGDNANAFALSNQLYKLGYDVDKATGQMTRRA